MSNEAIRKEENESDDGVKGDFTPFLVSKESRAYTE
jgi:hypothetical protein